MNFADTDYFEELFLSFYPGLVAFANKQLNDIAVSEDLVQELFIYLYENKDSIDIKGSLKPYLFQSVFNKCKSHQRKLHTIEKYETEISGEDRSTYQNQLETTEFEERVYHAIEQLPERCREIFKLNRFEDFSNDEIADRLGISKRTVETQISKALKILRGKLDPTTFFIFFI